VSNEEDSIQGSLEKSAQVSRIVFNAPPTFLTYAYVVLASAFFGLFLRPTPTGALVGFLLLGVPALIAGPLSAPIANALGGTLYYKRAAFLAAVSATLVGAVLVLSVPFRVFFDIPRAHLVLLGYMMATSTRHATLWATSDNRHMRSLPVAFLQVFAALPFIGIALPLLGGGPLGIRELWIAIALAVIFLGPLVFFLHVFDTPLKKGFKVSGSELFRYYLDHLTSGRMDGEAILNRFAEPIRAKFGVVGFRRKSDGSLKAAIIVPALHPGPIGRLGGSDLPGKVAEAIPDCDLVMVPHGAATHDYNPVSTADVERFGKTASKLLQELEYNDGSTRAITSGEDIRVTSQVFGDTALLTYTSWPLPIDDVEYGVGLAAEHNAQLAGAKRAFFVDCHNSLLPGAGQVALCTPRADAIQVASKDATARAAAGGLAPLRVGVSQDKTSFGRAHLIGAQGVQVIATETDGQRFAYILWDGNNAVPEVTRLVGEAIKDIVDGYQVMTTDNHSVNAVAGSYGPVGHLAPPADIAKVTRLAVEQALSDLEPVQSGGVGGVLEDFRVFGNQKTVQLTASINTMASILVELLIATVSIQWMGTALLFLLLR